jgi:DNA-binding transcriptional LysR family regulator
MSWPPTPWRIVGAAIQARELKVVDVGARPEDEVVFMAHPEGRRPSAKLRALAAHLRAAFGDPPYWDR